MQICWKGKGHVKGLSEVSLFKFYHNKVENFAAYLWITYSSKFKIYRFLFTWCLLVDLSSLQRATTGLLQVGSFVCVFNQYFYESNIIVYDNTLCIC